MCVCIECIAMFEWPCTFGKMRSMQKSTLCVKLFNFILHLQCEVMTHAIFKNHYFIRSYMHIFLFFVITLYCHNNAIHNIVCRSIKNTFLYLYSWLSFINSETLTAIWYVETRLYIALIPECYKYKPYM